MAKPSNKKKSIYLSLGCTRTSKMTRIFFVTQCQATTLLLRHVSLIYQTTTARRILYDRPSISRKMKIFHNKTYYSSFFMHVEWFQFFIGTVSFKLKTASWVWIANVYSKSQCFLSVMSSTTLVACTYHCFVAYILLNICFYSTYVCKLYYIFYYSAAWVNFINFIGSVLLPSCPCFLLKGFH